jgi:outer membrane biosynthesis protein TonB
MRTVDEVLAMRALDPAGLGRMMKWSFGIHFGIVLLAIVVPRDWITSNQPQPEVMTISLGAGTPGPRSGGQTSIGSRTAEEVAPPPPRPLPVTPATSRPPPADTSVSLPKPPPPATTKPPAPIQRPPTTGQQVQRGTSSAETGAQQDAAGLSFGGEGGQAFVSADFCCPWYFEEMKGRIQQRWRSDLPGVRTDTVLQFTIMSDGTITNVQVITSGSTMGELEARKALGEARLNPIPRQATEREIVVRLTFPYGREE